MSRSGRDEIDRINEVDVLDETDEIFDLVDEQGQVIGRATRRECHSDPRLLHQAVHVFVFNSEGAIFLQRRSRHKKIQPGRWDTSVGGHVAPGEPPLEAALREMKEELGITAVQPELLHQYIWRSPVESELVRTYRCEHEGPFRLHPGEIGEGRFCTIEEIARMAKDDQLTPNLVHELGLLGILPDKRSS